MNTKTFRYKTITALLIVSLFFGCSVKQPRVPTTMDLSKNEGMLVGTISFEDGTWTALDNYFLYTNDSINKLKPGLIKPHYRVSRPGHRGNFTEDKKEIYYFSIVKPAGKYSFYAAEVFLNTGYMQSSKLLPIDFPFEIEKGKVNYLGELHLSLKTGEIRLLDKLERDKAKFNVRYPMIPFN